MIYKLGQKVRIVKNERFSMFSYESKHIGKIYTISQLDNDNTARLHETDSWWWSFHSLSPVLEVKKVKVSDLLN